MALPAIGGPVIRPGMRAAGLSRLSGDTGDYLARTATRVAPSPGSQLRAGLRPQAIRRGRRPLRGYRLLRLQPQPAPARVRGADGPAARLRRDHDLGAA